MFKFLFHAMRHSSSSSDIATLFFATSILLLLLTSIPACSNNLLRADTEVFFCPEDDCDEVMISLIDSTEESLYIAVFSLNHEGITDAIVRAKKRGEGEWVLVEAGQIPNSEDRADPSDFDAWDAYKLLEDSGVHVLKDKNPRYMHNKLSLIPI